MARIREWLSSRWQKADLVGVAVNLVVATLLIGGLAGAVLAKAQSPAGRVDNGDAIGTADGDQEIVNGTIAPPPVETDADDDDDEARKGRNRDRH